MVKMRLLGLVLCVLLFQYMKLYCCHIIVKDFLSEVPEVDQNCQLVSYGYITCVKIPRIVSYNATDVLVTHHRVELTPIEFGHASWRHVQRLELHGPNVTNLQHQQLSGLDNLTELVLRCHRLRWFSNDSFANLKNLRKLSMLDQLHLYDAMTQSFVVGGALPILEELTISPTIRSSSTNMSISESFVHGLLYKPLTMVSFSNIELRGNYPTAMSLMKKLDVLNISGSHIVLLDYIRPQILFDYPPTPLLQTFDISKTNMPLDRISQSFSGKQSHNTVSNVAGKDGLILWLRTIENLIANNMPNAQHFYFPQANFTGVRVWLKSLIMRKNNFKIINFDLTLDSNNSFEVVDFSTNKIEFLSPNVISTAIHLKEIYLSENNLAKMEALPEFARLFFPHTELEILDLSSNNITSIPWKMFEENKNMRRLYLSHNRLSTIMFNLSRLVNLTLLDLRNNAIQSIEGSFLNHVEQYFEESRVGSDVLQLQDNPIECVCAHLDFIQWFSSYLETSQSPGGHSCRYEGRYIEIDSPAVEKVDFLCRRNTIIAMSTVCSLVGVGVSVVTFVLLRKRQKKLHRVSFEERFKDAFLAGRLQYSYLTFLSYASKDEHIVIPQLRTNIIPSMKTKLETDINVISTVEDFSPGFPIAEETFKTIKASCVFVAVVSESFCQSNYCLAEIREASDQQRPIILIFIGQVEEEAMTPYMREIFRRNARGKIIQIEDGRFEMIPCAGELCESVWALAVDDAETRELVM